MPRHLRHSLKGALHRHTQSVDVPIGIVDGRGEQVPQPLSMLIELPSLEGRGVGAHEQQSGTQLRRRRRLTIPP